MKKILIIIFLFLCIHKVNSQRSDDAIMFDAFLSSLTNQNNLVVIEKSAEFVYQENFFSKDFLSDYTHPTIGVDSQRVKKLIKKMDFNYLKNEKTAIANWDFSVSKFKILKYSDDVKITGKAKAYSIARPVYSKDLKMAFIYYHEFCGIDCGSSGVKVFMKCKGNWKLYLTIPLSIS